MSELLFADVILLFTKLKKRMKWLIYVALTSGLLLDLEWLNGYLQNYTRNIKQVKYKILYLPSLKNNGGTEKP